MGQELVPEALVLSIARPNKRRSVIAPPRVAGLVANAVTSLLVIPAEACCESTASKVS